MPPAPPADAAAPMTGSARLLAAAHRQPVDATPVWFMRQAGRSLPAYRRLRQRHDLLTLARTPELCTEVTLLPVDALGVDGAVLFADIMLPLEGMGVPFRIEPDVGPVIPDPLRRAADVARLRVLDAEAATPYVFEALRMLRPALGDRAALIGFAGSPFTLACYLVEGRATRDYPRTRAMVHGAPRVFEALMTTLTEVVSRYLVAQVEAGAQMVQLFDSWAGVVSAEVYDRQVRPHVARVFAALEGRAPAIYFATGAGHLLGSLAATGSPGFGVDWRVPLDEAWDRLGADRFLQGNLDPAALLAPWPVTARATREVLRRARGRPGHIFNLGHGVDPATDPARLAAVVDLVRRVTGTPAYAGAAVSRGAAPRAATARGPR